MNGGQEGTVACGNKQAKLRVDEAQAQESLPLAHTPLQLPQTCIYLFIFAHPALSVPLV